MGDFEDIYRDAVERVTEASLHDRLPEIATEDELRSLPDHRYLAAMARAAFSAGFKHYIVDAMWDGFEDAFERFDPETVASFDNDKILELGDNDDIVRNKTKIWATVENARMVLALSDEHGSFGDYIANVPLDRTVQLWEVLAERGVHLGVSTGPRSLRHVGRDTFILTRDVTFALRERLGVMSYSRNSKTGRRQAQETFLAWHEQTGRPLAHLSMILACAQETPDRY